jgi:hypothetical protein
MTPAIQQMNIPWNPRVKVTLAMNPKLLLCLALVLSGGLYCRAAILYPKAPDGGQQLIRETFQQGLSRSISRYLGGYQIEELTIADPFRDYSVGLTNLASGQLLPAARPGTWRYLLLHGTNAVAAAELRADSTHGAALKFAGLDTPGFSSETLKALRLAEQLPQIQKSDYELRRLDCPSLLFVAVWLHGKSDDILIPLPPAKGQWTAYQPYSESDMIKQLKPEAEKKLKMPSGLVD